MNLFQENISTQSSTKASALFASSGQCALTNISTNTPAEVDSGKRARIRNSGKRAKGISGAVCSSIQFIRGLLQKRCAHMIRNMKKCGNDCSLAAFFAVTVLRVMYDINKESVAIEHSNRSVVRA